jgi:hypothetical protein
MQHNLIFSPEIYLDAVWCGMLPFISIFAYIYIYIYILNEINNGPHPWLNAFVYILYLNILCSLVKVGNVATLAIN